MYEYLKKMLPVAEDIGIPREIDLDIDCHYAGNWVRIAGKTSDGDEYVLELTVKKKEAHDA